MGDEVTYKPLLSVQPFDVVPGQFLDDMISFYCDKPQPDILDPTCNKRRMWGKSQRKIVAVDINPEVKPDVVADHTNLPFADASFDIITYDPPHTGDQGKSKTEFAAKYGIGVKSKNPETGKWGNLFHTYPAFLKEAKRISASEWGLVGETRRCNTRTTISIRHSGILPRRQELRVRTIGLPHPPAEGRYL